MHNNKCLISALDNSNECLLFKSQKSVFNRAHSLNSKNASLYLTNLDAEDRRTELIIYDIKSERKEIKFLDPPELLDSYTCITQLPNGDIFCFGKYPQSGITLIIDKDYKIRKLRSGTPCRLSSAIYFDRNLYCFGGKDDWKPLCLSSRFNLNHNRWFNLAPLPRADVCCNSVIFDGNILISGKNNKTLLLYSAYSNSFSEILYEFSQYKRKILINEEKVYLIECEGFIYESEDAYNWIAISSWITEIVPPYQVFWSYSRGDIHIGCVDIWNRYVFFKFSLNEKILT